MTKLFSILFVMTVPMQVMALGRAQTAEPVQIPNCVKSEFEIATAPKVQEFVNEMGGIQSIEGSWKLSGFAGKFKTVVINFNSASDGLKALVQGMDPSVKDPKWGPIVICDTVRADTLQVKVLKTKQSLYMRVGSDGTLELAQISNGAVGSFYSFAKDTEEEKEAN